MSRKDDFQFFLMPILGMGVGMELAWIIVNCELGAILATVFNIAMIIIWFIGRLMYDAGRNDGKGI